MTCLAEIRTFTEAHRGMPLELCTLVGEYLPDVKAVKCNHVWDGIKMYLHQDHISAHGHEIHEYPSDWQLPQSCGITFAVFYEDYSVLNMVPCDPNRPSFYELVKFVRDHGFVHVVNIGNPSELTLSVRMYCDHWSIGATSYTYLAPVVSWHCDTRPLPVLGLTYADKKVTIRTDDNRIYTVRLPFTPVDVIDAGSAITCLFDEFHACIPLPR